MALFMDRHDIAGGVPPADATDAAEAIDEVAG